MRRHEICTAATDVLMRVPGFGGCSLKQLAEIDRLSDRSVALPGRVLVREGMIGREFFIILSGTASLTRRGRLISTLGAGDYFGELGALDTGHRNATLTALSALDVLIIGPRELCTLMADIPGFRDNLLRGMARRLRAADDTVERMRPITPSDPGAEIHQFAAREPVLTH